MSRYDSEARASGHQDAPPSATMIELAVTGRLDRAAVPRIEMMFDAALRRRPDRLVLDVAHCDYVDATGIVFLIDLHRRSQRAGGILELWGPSARLRRLLEIARVHHVLQIKPRPAHHSNASEAAMGVARPPN